MAIMDFFCMNDDDRDCSVMAKYYRGRKRAIKTKKPENSFRLSNYFRKRKRACKSKPVAGDITVKKPKLVHDVALRFILRKRERESPLLLEDSDLESRVSNSEQKQGIEESSSAASALLQCGRFDDYEALEEIGIGGYGTVYRARDTRTDEIVAMKEQFDATSLPTLREIEILSSLEPHPNIVGFKEVVADGNDTDTDSVYVVMEHADYDLDRYMAACVLSAADIKSITKQLLQGVKFLHENNVMHRDLKPSNILVSSEGELKICDFGLSRRMDAAGGLYAPGVGTGWYRAPEVIRGVEAYTEAVDMWSVGCVMAEMLLTMGGDAEARHRLEEIGRIVEGGEGSEEAYDWLRSEFFPATVVDGDGFDLLCRLLSWDPSERITAEAALSHVWFEEEESS